VVTDDESQQHLDESPIVLVHGAFHGGWCWEAVKTELEGRGRRVEVVPQLPSGGATPDGVGGLHDDAAAVRGVLERIGEPVVLVGHSYGGAVITELAGSPMVSEAVYVTGFWPERGQCVLDLANAMTVDVPPWYAPAGETVLAADPDMARIVLYADVEPGLAEAAVNRLGLQSMASATEKSTTRGWGTTPTTYVVCTADLTIPPADQDRYALRADRVVYLESGHSPFLTRPRELAELLSPDHSPSSDDDGEAAAR
jgi:pimeloyl-ACP methyl ester carboxylesterase